MKLLHQAAFVLLIVGGLNWGLVALFDLNVVNMIFGSMAQVEQIVYILVGASAVYIGAKHMSGCKTCNAK